MNQAIIDTGVIVALLNKNDYYHPWAIADYDQALRLNPNYSDAYYNRGVAKNDLGGALDDLRRAVELFFQQGNTQWYNYSRNKIIEIGG